MTLVRSLGFSPVGLSVANARVCGTHRAVLNPGVLDRVLTRREEVARGRDAGLDAARVATADWVHETARDMTRCE
jgi:hypothetical protein